MNRAASSRSFAAVLCSLLLVALVPPLHIKAFQLAATSGKRPTAWSQQKQHQPHSRLAFVRDAYRQASNSESDSRRRSVNLEPARLLSLRLAAQQHSAGADDDDDDDDEDECRLSPVPPKWDGVPIPFVEIADKAPSSSQSLGFIECFADSLAHCLGSEYVIGVPCDYSVALCYYSTDDESDPDRELIPLELDDPELDDVFPIAEAIVADGASVVCSFVFCVAVGVFHAARRIVLFRANDRMRTYPRPATSQTFVCSSHLQNSARSSSCSGPRKR
jgi:hypothetical protein